MYKQLRNIRNFRDQIDDIVGVKTIKSLDDDLQPSKPKQQPGPPPSRPKKPNVFPVPDGPNCVNDEGCPISDQFEVELVATASIGEGLEGAVFLFRIRDTKNMVTARYKLTALGIGLSKLPVGAGGGGKPSPFRTSKPVRVTRFGPAASFGFLTIPQTTITFGRLNLSFRPEGSTVPGLRAFIDVDTGPVTIPGSVVGVHGGPLSLLSTCRGKPGATRGIDTGPF